MKPKYFGTEEVVAADLAYDGSTFSEVRDALFANPLCLAKTSASTKNEAFLGRAGLNVIIASTEHADFGL